MNNIENGQSAAEQGYQMKDIPGWEGLYACTTHGDIWSHRSDKFLSPSKNKRGYLHVTFTKDGKRYDYRVNRLIAITFLDNPNNLPQVNHIDGNKLNNNYDNLEWCDQVHNMKEASRMGLLKIKRGAESNLYSGKLNIDISNMIRSIRSNEKLSYDKIAKMFDVSKATIINICKNRIYT